MHQGLLNNKLCNAHDDMSCFSSLNTRVLQIAYIYVLSVVMNPKLCYNEWSNSKAIWALFSCKFFYKMYTVVFLFVFDKYYPIID